MPDLPCQGTYVLASTAFPHATDEARGTTAHLALRQCRRRHRIGMYDAVQGVLCDWSLGLFVRTGHR